MKKFNLFLIIGLACLSLLFAVSCDNLEGDWYDYIPLSIEGVESEGTSTYRISMDKEAHSFTFNASCKKASFRDSKVMYVAIYYRQDSLDQEDPAWEEDGIDTRDITEVGMSARWSFGKIEMISMTDRPEYRVTIDPNTTGFERFVHISIGETVHAGNSITVNQRAD